MEPGDAGSSVASDPKLHLFTRIPTQEPNMQPNVDQVEKLVQQANAQLKQPELTEIKPQVVVEADSKEIRVEVEKQVTVKRTFSVVYDAIPPAPLGCTYVNVRQSDGTDELVLMRPAVDNYALQPLKTYSSLPNQDISTTFSTAFPDPPLGCVYVNLPSQNGHEVMLMEPSVGISVVRSYRSGNFYWDFCAYLRLTDKLPTSIWHILRDVNHSVSNAEIFRRVHRYLNVFGFLLFFVAVLLYVETIPSTISNLTSSLACKESDWQASGAPAKIGVAAAIITLIYTLVIELIGSCGFRLWRKMVGNPQFSIYSSEGDFAEDPSESNCTPNITVLGCGVIAEYVVSLTGWVLFFVGIWMMATGIWSSNSNALTLFAGWLFFEIFNFVFLFVQFAYFFNSEKNSSDRCSDSKSEFAPVAPQGKYFVRVHNINNAYQKQDELILMQPRCSLKELLSYQNPYNYGRAFRSGDFWADLCAYGILHPMLLLSVFFGGDFHPVSYFRRFYRYLNVFGWNFFFVSVLLHEKTIPVIALVTQSCSDSVWRSSGGPAQYGIASAIITILYSIALEWFSTCVMRHWRNIVNHPNFSVHLKTFFVVEQRTPTVLNINIDQFGVNFFYVFSLAGWVLFLVGIWLMGTGSWSVSTNLFTLFLAWFFSELVHYFYVFLEFSVKFAIEKKASLKVEVESSSSSSSSAGPSEVVTSIDKPIAENAAMKESESSAFNKSEIDANNEMLKQ